MMGTRSPQDKLFAADQIYLDYVGLNVLTRAAAWCTFWGPFTSGSPCGTGGPLSAGQCARGESRVR
jgi:hypothetical protein